MSALQAGRISHAAGRLILRPIIALSFTRIRSRTWVGIKELFKHSLSAAMLLAPALARTERIVPHFSQRARKMGCPTPHVRFIHYSKARATGPKQRRGGRHSVG